MSGIRQLEDLFVRLHFFQYHYLQSRVSVMLFFLLDKVFRASDFLESLSEKTDAKKNIPIQSSALERRQNLRHSKSIGTFPKLLDRTLPINLPMGSTGLSIDCRYFESKHTIKRRLDNKISLVAVLVIIVAPYPNCLTRSSPVLLWLLYKYQSTDKASPNDSTNDRIRITHRNRRKPGYPYIN